jgi:FMN phosphatase YigB (HAD superfamily)
MAILLCDLDDTLIQTSALYYAARVRAARLIKNYTGSDASIDEIERKIDRIDVGRIPIDGYGKERFLNSVRIVYGMHLGNRELLHTAANEKNIMEAASGAFGIPPFYEDAPSFLDYIQTIGTENVLFTVGDRDLQYRKINALQLRRYFADIVVRQEKTFEEYSDVVDTTIELQAIPRIGIWDGTVIVVGDSMLLDMFPAWKLGYHSIFINRGDTWQGFGEKYTDIPTNMCIVDSLTDAMIAIEEILEGVKP